MKLFKFNILLLFIFILGCGFQSTLKIKDNNEETYILKIYFKDANYNKTLLENFKKEFNINFSPYLDSLIEPPILVTSLKTENIYCISGVLTRVHLNLNMVMSEESQVHCVVYRGRM